MLRPSVSERKTPCRSGGIGRRAWFRSMYSQGCGGSSPPFGTKTIFFNSLKRLLLAVLLFAGNNWFRLALAGDRWSSATSAKLRSHRNFRGASVANKIAVVYQHVKINNKWTFQKAPTMRRRFLSDGAYYISWYEGTRKRMERVGPDPIESSM